MNVSLSLTKLWLFSFRLIENHELVIWWNYFHMRPNKKVIYWLGTEVWWNRGPTVSIQLAIQDQNKKIFPETKKKN
jgi:hypothetical protein